jgi:hypothetical protein
MRRLKKRTSEETEVELKENQKSAREAKAAEKEVTDKKNAKGKNNLSGLFQTSKIPAK